MQDEYKKTFDQEIGKLKLDLNILLDRLASISNSVMSIQTNLSTEKAFRDQSIKDLGSRLSHLEDYYRAISRIFSHGPSNLHWGKDFE